MMPAGKIGEENHEPQAGLIFSALAPATIRACLT